MRCPVCGKHVAEERYEVHVGRHTDVGMDAAPAELESVPATVGASTLESVPVGASVDAGALLLGPEGSAMPLPEDDHEESVAIASSDDETSPVEVGGEGAVAPSEEVEDGAAPTVVDDEPTVVEDAPTVVEDAAPVAATAPLAVEPPAPWGPPPAAPLGGEAPETGRRSPLPILGLVALVIIAAIVVFVVTRDDGGTKNSARVKATATTTKPTFGSVATPGSPGATSPTPTFPPPPNALSQAPPLLVPPPAPGVAPPPGASAPPGSTSAAAGQIQVTPASAECDEDTGRVVVNGTIVNRGSARYNVQFTVNITSAGGAPLGNAQGAAVVGSGESRSFQATGTCSGPLGPGNRQQTQIQSVTPA
jgi:hypothetical protein